MCTCLPVGSMRIAAYVALAPTGVRDDTAMFPPVILAIAVKATDQTHTHRILPQRARRQLKEDARLARLSLPMPTRCRGEIC